MYLEEADGVFTDDINYKIVSDNDKLNNFTIIIANKILKELHLYDLEYMEFACTTEEFNDLLESIKLIWELEYPDYTIKYWRTKSNKLFLQWLGVENFKDYC
jgi:hypothetical protein